MFLCKARNFGHFRLFDSDACIHDAPAFGATGNFFHSGAMVFLQNEPI
jgi:hypothetical protein